MDEASAPAEPAKQGINKSAAAKLIIATIVAVAFAVFAIQNTAATQVDFLAWTFNTRRIILILISAVAGIVIWELAGRLRQRNR